MQELLIYRIEKQEVMLQGTNVKVILPDTYYKLSPLSFFILFFICIVNSLIKVGFHF